MFAVKLIIRTALFLLFISLLYFIAVVAPDLLMQRELLKAKRSIYPKYFSISLNRSMQTQYLSLKSESMNFYSEKGNVMAKIDESIKNSTEAMKTPYKRGLLLFPKKEMVLVLDYIQKQDTELSDDAVNVLKKQETQLSKIKELSSVLANLYIYDLAVDVGGLDVKVNNDREKAIEASQKANKGLLVISGKLRALGDEYKPLTASVESMAYNFSLMEKYANDGNTIQYKSEYEKILKDYEVFRKEAFSYEIKLFRKDEYLQILSDEKKIIQKYEEILGKLDEI